MPTYKDIFNVINDLESETYSVKVLYVTRAGSQLYGTATPTSDTDYKGIYVSNKQNYDFGKEFKAPTFFDFGTGDDKSSNTSDDVDCDFYSIESFFNGLAKGEAGAVDILFSMWSDQIVYSNPKLTAWCKANYLSLISSNPKAFIGFATGQARRYGVKGQRYNELVKVIDLLEDFELTSYGLKVQDFQGEGQIEKYTHVKWTSAPACRGTEGDWTYLDVLGKLYAPHVTITHVLKLLKAMEDSYGMRVKKTDDGIDWKALSHATRATFEIIELLIENKITFPLKDAKLLLDIKQGKYRLDTVCEMLERNIAKVDDLVAASKLPSQADVDFSKEFIDSFYS